MQQLPYLQHQLIKCQLRRPFWYTYAKDYTHIKSEWARLPQMRGFARELICPVAGVVAEAMSSRLANDRPARTTLRKLRHQPSAEASPGTGLALDTAEAPKPAKVINPWPPSTTQLEPRKVLRSPLQSAGGEPSVTPPRPAPRPPRENAGMSKPPLLSVPELERSSVVANNTMN